MLLILRDSIPRKVRRSFWDAGLLGGGGPGFVGLERTSPLNSEGHVLEILGEVRLLHVWLEEHDRPYTEYIEANLHFAVTSLQVDYTSSARFDERLDITTWAEWVGGASLHMAYRVSSGDELKVSHPLLRACSGRLHAGSSCVGRAAADSLRGRHLVHVHVALRVGNRDALGVEAGFHCAV